MEKVDITIIGAGVVGLAIAEKLSSLNKDIFVVEKESCFGQGASSRNSEVIHAGIYYPTESLKAKMCVEGSRLLYEFCQSYHIPFKKLGKLIVATNKEEITQVEEHYKLGSANGVLGLKIIDSAEIKKIEPNTTGICALFSPETGILDTHKFMSHLEAKEKENGVGIVYGSQVRSIEKQNSSYRVDIEDKNKDIFSFLSSVVINSAGLFSDLVAQMVGIDISKSRYNLKYCKGEYFRLSPSKCGLIQKLIYPVPKQSDGGLGIHLTPDISGQVRLGPDAEYMQERIEDYAVNKNKQEHFYNSVNKFAPFINLEDIYPDMSGIRPKLQGPDEEFRDFVIREETDKGLPGFINLIGIESPGFTCALSIARYVETLLRRQ